MWRALRNRDVPRRVGSDRIAVDPHPRRTTAECELLASRRTVAASRTGEHRSCAVQSLIQTKTGAAGAPVCCSGRSVCPRRASLDPSDNLPAEHFQFVD